MIKGKGLTKDYGAFRAVDKISFEVQGGDVLGFLGPNGAGKSTTMKMVTGFLSPTAGTASIGGHDTLQEPAAAKKLLGYLPESGPLYQEMTVLEFLKFVSEIRGLRGDQRTQALTRVLDTCHLEPVRHQTIDTLSKGFRQRVGMAQAILHQPPCLIMDEPTDGLDPNQKQEVRKLIAGMGRDKAIILSTHILEEVQAMCNRVIIIAGGKVVVDETPDELLKRHPRHNAVRLAIREADTPVIRTTIEGMPQVASVDLVDGAFVVVPRKNQDIRAPLWEAAREKNWKVSMLETIPVRLEDVFAKLTTEEPAPSVSPMSAATSRKTDSSVGVGV